MRKTQSDVYDVTGQHVLWSLRTLVPLASDATDAMARDNHCHDEIRDALRQERDAQPFVHAATAA